jgi:transcriptional regulator with XRE-family HTH domain
MTMGEKLRAARLEAGLSQRQLCQGLVTRNMLSQIENGSAKPSLPTLQVLAQRLNKNVQYFLEDDPSPAFGNRDEALIHWALEDLQNGQAERAVHLLAALEHPGGNAWHLARGCLLTAQGEYALAIGHLKQGESCRPDLAWANLEICYRETGDFQSAYFYACKQRTAK